MKENNDDGSRLLYGPKDMVSEVCGRVEGLPDGKPRVDIYKYFCRFGKVIGVHVRLRDNGTEYHGEGLIQYRTAAELRRAKKLCNWVNGNRYIG